MIFVRNVQVQQIALGRVWKEDGVPCREFA